MESKKKHRRLLRIFLFGVMVVCLFLLGQAYHNTLRQRKLQKELLLIKENADAGIAGLDRQEDETESSKTPDVQIEPKPLILNQYSELYEKNHDLAGWITIDGTVIDYPVMQCEDNEYYLHHDFYQEESKYGCLYVKDIADFDKGTNFIIYGHSMKDGSMFGSLERFRNEAYYLEHPEISFDTLYEERVYQIVAAFPSQVYNVQDKVFKYYQFYQADTQEEFDYFYENIKALSLYDTGVEAEYGDTFLTLSTCAYHVEDGRFVVVAKRVR